MTLGGNGRSFRAAAMAEVGRMSPVGRFLLSVAFSGVLLSMINTLDAKKVRTRVVAIIDVSKISQRAWVELNHSLAYHSTM